MAGVLSALANHQVVVLDGAAGTGKTTMIKALHRQLKLKHHAVVVTAYTNKAVQVLRAKGVEATGTFHSHCLRPHTPTVVEELKDYLLAQKREPFISPPSSVQSRYGERMLTAMRTGTVNDALRMAHGVTEVEYVKAYYPRHKRNGVLIVDEASMVGGNQLDAAKKVFDKIILVGDSHQLSPIKDSVVFPSIQPRMTLTTIMRQPANSKARELASAIRSFTLPDSFTRKVLNELSPLVLARMSAGKACIITYTNEARKNWNLLVRRQLGHSPYHPVKGDLLVCRHNFDNALKRDGMFNGSFWKVLSSSGDFVCSLLNLDTGTVKHDVPIFLQSESVGCGIVFDYAYCLTAHTAQGSEFEEVYIDSHGLTAWMKHISTLTKSKRQRFSWLYTAVTRAKHNVYRLKL